MQVVLGVQHSDLQIALQLYLDGEPDLFVVGTATETASLRALLWTADPDLVILDWSLPGPCTSLEVLAEAKQLQRCPQVIVLGRNEGIRRKALAAGAADFVLSGDLPGDLIAAIRQSRARHRAGIETAAALRGATPQAAASGQILEEATKA